MIFSEVAHTEWPNVHELINLLLSQPPLFWFSTSIWNLAAGIHSHSATRSSSSSQLRLRSGLLRTFLHTQLGRMRLYGLLLDAVTPKQEKGQRRNGKLDELLCKRRFT